MTIEEMKRIKKEKGYTYVMMSEMSGVPDFVLEVISSSTKKKDYTKKLKNAYAYVL